MSANISALENVAKVSLKLNDTDDYRRLEHWSHQRLISKLHEALK